MTWDIIIKLIIEVGLPLALKILQKWTGGADPTPQDIAELSAMANEDARSLMLKTLASLNIDPNSDQGKALLALTPA